MTKREFIEMLIEDTNSRYTEKKINWMINTMSKNFQAAAEKYLLNSNRELDKKFVLAMIAGGNCK